MYCWKVYSRSSLDRKFCQYGSRSCRISRKTMEIVNHYQSLLPSMPTSLAKVINRFVGRHMSNCCFCFCIPNLSTGAIWLVLCAQFWCSSYISIHPLLPRVS